MQTTEYFYKIKNEKGLFYDDQDAFLMPDFNTIGSRFNTKTFVDYALVKLKKIYPKSTFEIKMFKSVITEI